MRGEALLDILFPLKFSCMAHHSSNLDSGKTEMMSVVEQARPELISYTAQCGSAKANARENGGLSVFDCPSPQDYNDG